MIANPPKEYLAVKRYGQGNVVMTCAEPFGEEFAIEEGSENIYLGKNKMVSYDAYGERVFAECALPSFRGLQCQFDDDHVTILQVRAYPHENDDRLYWTDALGSVYCCNPPAMDCFINIEYILVQNRITNYEEIRWIGHPDVPPTLYIPPSFEANCTEYDVFPPPSVNQNVLIDRPYTIVGIVLSYSDESHAQTRHIWTRECQGNKSIILHEDFHQPVTPGTWVNIFVAAFQYDVIMAPSSSNIEQIIEVAKYEVIEPLFPTSLIRGCHIRLELPDYMMPYLFEPGDKHQHKILGEIRDTYRQAPKAGEKHNVIIRLDRNIDMTDCNSLYYWDICGVSMISKQDIHDSTATL